VTACEAPHPDAELLALCSDLLVAMNELDALSRWMDRLPAAEAQGIFDALNDPDGLWKHERDLFSAVIATPARTLFGLQSKALVALEMMDPGITDDATRLAVSLARDILSIAGAGATAPPIVPSTLTTKG
jgi:hypothetical protein